MTAIITSFSVKKHFGSFYFVWFSLFYFIFSKRPSKKKEKTRMLDSYSLDFYAKSIVIFVILCFVAIFRDIERETRTRCV